MKMKNMNAQTHVHEFTDSKGVLTRLIWNEIDPMKTIIETHTPQKIFKFYLFNDVETHLRAFKKRIKDDETVMERLMMLHPEMEFSEIDDEIVKILNSGDNEKE